MEENSHKISEKTTINLENNRNVNSRKNSFNKDDFLFELSWEVCNKVGGIYTVITSKISTILKNINYENYFLVGPYLNNENNNSEFIKETQPEFITQANKNLENLGIKIHYGKWKTPSSKDTPQTLLIEYLSHSKNINEIKKTLWEKFQIDSLGSNWYDFDEAILWSWSCGIAIEEISNMINQNDSEQKVLTQTNNQENNYQLNPQSKTIIHAHEWMSGGSIFYIKSQNKLVQNKIKTVFTTHATMLGRALSGNNYNIYEMATNKDLVKNFNADKNARDIGVHTKFQSEKALAIHSDCFTTVSDITAQEAKIFFKKEPNKLLYNGFNLANIATQEDFNMLFNASRKKQEEVLENHFFKYYKFDIKTSQIFYTSGRNEFRNKGVDIYIKALGKLNRKLKKEKSTKNIINLFLIPIGEFSKIKYPTENSQYFNLAPLSSHNIPTNNEIISELIKESLLNHKDDNIKILVIPTYLDAKDEIFSMNYYDVIAGLDLGIFPSFYEPWGYTPLESIAYAVPAITTDFAGFGRAILKDYPNSHTGIKILKRENISQEETVENFYKYMYNQTKKNKEEIQLERDEAKQFAKKFTWEKFILNYLDAYNIAKNNF